MTGYDYSYLGVMRHVRRFAVPAWMIERATERRRAGDWRGACAAANVDVRLDLAEVARVHGRDVATRVEDDLRHLVPDLLRWHVPRYRHTGALVTGVRVPLALYPDPARALLVGPPPHANLPERLTLHFASAQPADLEYGMHLNRELWDDRHTDELLVRWVGGDRAPFFTADGRRLPAGQYGPVERIVMLQDEARVPEAWDAAGIDLDPTPPSTKRHSWTKPPDIMRYLSAATINLATLSASARAAAEATGAEEIVVPAFDTRLALLLTLGRLDTERPTARVVTSEAAQQQGLPSLSTAAWHRPVDLDLLRAKRLAPQELHPLVGAAVFPALGAPTGPPAPRAPEPLRVRCHGEWHRVVMGNGTIQTPHSPEEVRRELTIAALGAPLQGCFEAHKAWRTPGLRIPRRMRELRRDLFHRARFGDTPGVRFLLESGVDPNTHGPEGSTLLHLLPMLDDVELLPKLLAAGLGIDVRNGLGRTPLRAAVDCGGSVELVRALLDAGADPEATCTWRETPISAMVRHGRADLYALLDRGAMPAAPAKKQR